MPFVKIILSIELDCVVVLCKQKEKLTFYLDSVTEDVFNMNAKLSLRRKPQTFVLSCTRVRRAIKILRAYFYSL